MRLTSAQETILRSRPHKTVLFMSIYRPKTIWQAQATGTFSIGDVAIPYFNNITGSFNSIYANQTLLIGSTQGGDEYGRLRIRSGTSSQLSMAENAILWQTGQWLTAIDIVDINAIYPKIISDPNNAENVLFFKDGNIPYANQNSIFGSFPNAGPHRAGFITGSVSFYFTATGTVNVNGESLTYSWAFEGGTPTGSTALTPGFVSWSTPGHYKTRLIVTSSSGAQDTTYRYVSTYNRPEQGTNVPILKWELLDFSGSRSEGGYNLRVKVFEDISSIEPNALVVLFADDSYGGTPTSLGGNAQNSASIIFTGYILKDSINFNYKESYAEFTIGSVSEVMKTAEGFSVSCESKASPTTWFELKEMSVQKALYHYLRWHSTVLNTTDFQYTGDDRLVQYFDTDRASLFDAVDNFLDGALSADLVSDRQGKLWAEISEFGLENIMTSIPLNSIGLLKQDWMGDPAIDERRTADSSFVELGGIVFYGVTTNTFSAIISNSPSTSPLYRGKPDTKEGFILNSQQQLNQITGNNLANRNNPIQGINLELTGNYRNLDIAPQERFNFLIDAADTVKNRNLNNYMFKIESMEWSYNSEKELFYPSINLAQISSGTAGVTVVIPAVVPDNTGFSYPSLHLPPLPGFSIPTAQQTAVTTVVLLHDVNSGFVYTVNFDSGAPNWLQMNGGLTVGQYQGANAAFICPNGAVYVARITYDDLGFIARAPALGQPFVIVEDSTSIKAKFGAVTTGVWGIACNPGSAEQVAYVVGTNGNARIYVGAGTSFVQGINFAAANNGISDIISQDFTKLTYGDNSWVLTSRKTTPSLHEHLFVFASGGGSITREVDLTTIGGNAVGHMRAGTSKIAYLANSAATKYLRTTDNFSSISSINLIDVTINSGAAYVGATIDKGGLQIMNRFNPGSKGKSNDGGFSYAFLPNLPPGNYFFQFAGGATSASYWIAAGGSVIRYSPDFGNTWVNKEGDITSSIPIPNIDMVKVVSS